ncbi:hypothetical protein D9M71_48400 [compost metagenome]
MWPQVGDQSFALGQRQRDAFIGVVRQLAVELQCMLTDRQQTLFLGGDGHTGRSVGMHHAIEIRARHVDRRMDHEACGIDPGTLVRTAHYLAMLVDAHQVAGFHAIENHAVAVDQKVVLRARDA